MNTGHLYEPEKLVIIEDVARLIGECNQKGYLVIVITNQAGIAKGYYTEEDMHRLHKVLNRQLQEKYGAHIDAFYHCPHHPAYSGPCHCRKPETGMLEQAIHEWEIDPGASCLFGDAETDLLCGKKMGIKSYDINKYLTARRGGGTEGLNG